MVPPGLETGAFAVAAERAAEPRLFCPASLGDPRKRAGLLFEAFERVSRLRPELRLQVIAPHDPLMSAAAPPIPAGVEVLRPTSEAGALARVYATAWATVLPAVEEAFGIVLTESLAAGTPVVADRSGAAPEILAGEERIGRLFERDDPGDLARAIDEALELGADPETAPRCRERASRYDWSRLIGAWDELYATASTAGH